jgi:hypothetical protein
MESTRTFTVIGRKDGQAVKLMITATTKWHALDKAMWQHPGYDSYQYSNIVRRNPQPIISKF